MLTQPMAGGMVESCDPGGRCKGILEARIAKATGERCKDVIKLVLAKLDKLQRSEGIVDPRSAAATGEMPLISLPSLTTGGRRRKLPTSTGLRC